MKRLSLLLVLAMVCACITVPVQAQEATTDRPVITIMNRVDASIDLGDDNPIVKAIEDKLGIDIQYDCAPPSSYADKEQIMMATGEMPDILYHHAAADMYLEQWSKDGLILQLDDYLPKYKNIMAQLTPEMQEAFRANSTGKIAAIARPHVKNLWGFTINKKWLTKLGLSEPTTVEEFAKVMEAFTKQDPDGDGKDDTYGTTMAMGNLTDYTNNGWASAYGLSYIKDDKTGEYNMIPRMTGYLPYLTFFHDLYAAGSLDPEWVVGGDGLTPSDASDKLYSGKLGCIMGTPGDVIGGVDTYGESVLTDFEYIAPMKNIYTGVATYYPIPPMWGCYMINAASQNIDKCLELIDYCFSPEGWTLQQMGIQGMHYNSYDITNRTVDRTADQAALLGTQTGPQVTFCNFLDGKGPIISDNENCIKKYWEDFNKVVPTVTEIDVPYNRAPKYASFDADHPDANKHLHTTESQYIMGEIDLAAMQSFLNDEYYPESEEVNADYSTWLAAQWTK